MIKRIDGIVCPGRYGSPDGDYICGRCGREIKAGEKYSAVVYQMATIDEPVDPGNGELVCSECVSLMAEESQIKAE